MTPADAPPLPDDCALLPVARGALLVSASHALFCAIDAAHLD